MIALKDPRQGFDLLHERHQLDTLEAMISELSVEVGEGLFSILDALLEALGFVVPEVNFGEVVALVHEGIDPLL